MNDVAILQISFALTALLSAILFFASYRATGSTYSLYWFVALLLLMTGGVLTFFEDTDLRALVLPIQDVSTAIGLSFAWGAARALRHERLSVWAFALPALLTGTATALSEPLSDITASSLTRYLTFAILFALTAREVLLIGRQFSRVRWSLFAASSTLSLYYLIRLLSSAAGSQAGEVLQVISSEATSIIVTEMALITVTFGMVSISQSEIESRLRAVASTSVLEMSEGVQVQQALLPFHRTTGAQFPISGACVPSRLLSGDFFDWQSDSRHLVVTVGDVMGKGVGAAMLGATVRAGLRVARRGDPAADVITVVDSLGDDLIRNGSFVTLFHAYLDRGTNVLSILDAGHGLAVLVRHDGTRQRISSKNLPVGINVGFEWEVAHCSLDPGDRLLVFSDGVLDLFDGTVASLDRAVDIALAPGVRSVDDAVDRIRMLAESGSHQDDVTIVAFERPLISSATVAAL